MVGISDKMATECRYKVPKVLEMLLDISEFIFPSLLSPGAQ